MFKYSSPGVRGGGPGGVENRNSFQGLYETLESNESAGFEMVGARWVVQPQQNIHNCLHDVLSFISSFSGNIYFIAFLYLIIPGGNPNI